MNEVIETLRKLLEGFLPLDDTSLSRRPLALVDSFDERPVGLGNWVGNERRGHFEVTAQKGGRVEAVIRLHIWADSFDRVNDAMALVHNRLLAAKNDLQTETPIIGRVLRLSAEHNPLPEQISSLNAWQKTADYRVLYEYQFAESDAESLIVRIFIDIDSQYNESMVITGKMVRWGDQEAPPLEIRGRGEPALHVRSLSILAFLPEDWDGEAVTLSVSNNGTTHELTFNSVRIFLNAFTLETGTVGLGGNPYRVGRLILPGADSPDAVILKGGDDIFRIRYAASAFDTNAVVYLRVLSEDEDR